MAQEIKITQTSNADMNIGVPKNMTAVEWLVEQLIPKAFATYDVTTHNAIQQAKQMEKQQIIDAHKLGFYYNLADPIVTKNSEKYYNETYKQ